VKAWQSIVAGGLVAGAVDIAAASTIFMVPPLRILRSVAAGLIGKTAAHDGGLTASLIGALCQEAISLVFAAFYVIVGLRFLPVLLRRPWLCGAVYGVGVYVVMNYIVVPLSAVHGHAPSQPMSILKNLGAMILYGLIIALFASRIRTEPAHGPAMAAA
jgi:uncharacterized membrane protein YagU involved in acid resistance